MRIKKKSLGYGAIIIIIAVAGVLGYDYWYKNSHYWEVSDKGLLKFNINNDIKFESYPYNENEYVNITEVVFESRGVNVYGLLVEPYSDFRLPGVVLLPGAGVSKESELGLAVTIARLGFIVITIDQRGVGETKYFLSDIDEDYKKFTEGGDVFQYLLVHDAIKAADVIRKNPKIEKDSIIIVGESLGGRVAVIAAAIDKRFNGALAISSSGLGFTPKGDEVKDKFISSIDADKYISLISPKRIAMIHNINDKNIPFEAAANTYSIAKEPKLLLYMNETEKCNHGYCNEMHDSLKNALNFVMGNIDK